MSNRCTPMIEKDAHQDDGQGTIGASSKQTIDEKPSARQRLDRMSGFKIRSKAIKVTSVNSLRSGGKADVFQAKLRRWYSISGQLVAVKKLRSTHTQKTRNEYVHEVEMMKGLSHKHLVQFVGFVEDLENGTAWIISSWEPNGNVSEFLARGYLEIPERVSLINDVFQGIKYLHTREPPICHGNLKSCNILVSSSYRAVITGFGSARAICEPEDEVTGDKSGQERQGTPSAEQAINISAAGNQLTLTGPAWLLNWEAPEVMNGERPGLSSDVWAAGWVCWEVITDSVPFAELSSEGMITLTVTQGKDPSARDAERLGHSVALDSLMTDCWALDAKARPNISRCCNELQWMPSTPPSSGDLSGSKAPSIDLLMQKGKMHYDQGSYKKSGLVFQHALSLSKSMGCRTDAAHALSWLGASYRAQAKYGQAEESYTQAHKIYARVGDDVGRANALTGLGDIYRDQSTFSLAEKSYTRAHEIYTRAGSDYGRANTLLGLADLHRAQSKYSLAEESYIQAQEISTRIGDDLGRANALDLLGEVYRLQSKFAQSEESHIRAQELFARIGGDLGRANTLFGLGQLYRDESRYAEAEESFARAQEIYARFDDDCGRALTLCCIGSLRRDLGRNAEAAAHYTEARDLFAQIGMAKEVENVSHYLAAVLPDHSSSDT